MAAPVYHTAVPESAFPRIAELLSLAFGGTVAECEAWVRSAQGRSALQRTLAPAPQPDRPDACLRIIPMGQFFGRRAVPMAGIAGVAVAPEARGQGLARRIMTEALRELHAGGTALSCLYASTQSLYRQVGYEQAGHRGVLTVPMGMIDVRHRQGAWRTLSQADVAVVKPLYQRFAAEHAGALDRNDLIWSRVWGMRDRHANMFIWYPDAHAPANAEPRAAVAVAQSRNPSGKQDLTVADFAYADADAARAIWAFLHDFASMADKVAFPGGPWHPLLLLLAQQRFAFEFKDYWMLRIVHAPSAIAARGYPAGLALAVDLHITDDLLPANAGRFVLRIADGQGQLIPGGNGVVRLPINALASLYSGLASARHLRTLALLDGPDAEIDALSAAFAGPTPAMIDFF
jgi:predicted acetyltransferase